MLSNHWKIALRNVRRKKFFSLINISGLAIGMTAAFFIFQYVYFETSFDRFHKHSDRLYRVGIRYLGGNFDPGSAANHPAVGPTMKSELGEVEDYARIFPLRLLLNNGQAKGLEPRSNTVFSYTGPDGSINAFNEDKVYVADASYFRLFSYPFLKGDPANALNAPDAVVISRTISEKYFGQENPLGKTLELNGTWPLKVTGVFENFPSNAHMHFDMLVSYASATADKVFDLAWTWPEFYTYVLLKKGVNHLQVSNKLPALIDRHMGR